MLRRIFNKSLLRNALVTTQFNNYSNTIIAPILTLNNVSKPNLQICRFKSKGNKMKKPESSTESESEEKDFMDDIADKHTKTMKINVGSLRLDLILRTALGIARNKIETMFYESKIRVNGEKVLKKSSSVREGDEIDVIKGVNVDNPQLLTVARVEILSTKVVDETISVKIRRNKSLTIENYTDKWSG